MATETVSAALQRVSLFRELPSEELEALSHQVMRRRFTRNEIIFSQGDPGDGLYIVNDGGVTISRQNPDGDELIFGVYESGDFFGELALFDQEPRSASAVSVSDSELFFLGRTTFRTFIEAHPRALYTCLTVIVAQLRRCTDIADEIALLDVRSRLARRLLRLAEQGVLDTGTRTRPARAYRITQQQLANMMGATRESVNKHLNAFVDEGIVHLERGHIQILDMERLEECGAGMS